MPDGFGTVPEELRSTASKIGDVIGKVAGAVWQGPSGDYGHAGVQAGWSVFIDEMKQHVVSLREKADNHGQLLVTAATSYLDREHDVDANLGKAGTLLESAEVPVGTVGSEAGDELPTGFFHPSISQRLNPGGAGDSAPAGVPGGQSGRLMF
jgi:hypothetical protein